MATHADLTAHLRSPAPLSCAQSVESDRVNTETVSLPDTLAPVTSVPRNALSVFPAQFAPADDLPPAVALSPHPQSVSAARCVCLPCRGHRRGLDYLHPQTPRFRRFSLSFAPESLMGLVNHQLVQTPPPPAVNILRYNKIRTIARYVCPLDRARFERTWLL